MDLTISLAVAAQLIIVCSLTWRFRGQALGKIGVLLMWTTFGYHGATELVQAIFPQRNDYRLLVTEASLHSWLITVTLAMALFTLAYAATAVRYSHQYAAGWLRHNLKGSYVLKWPVLLAIGMLGLSAVILRSPDQEQLGGYFVSGLADQFSSFVLTLCLTAMCLAASGRLRFIFFSIFALVIATSGSRTLLFVTIMTALSALIRYGVPLSKKAMLGFCVVIFLGFALISLSRATYGRFHEGEGLYTRALVILGGAEAANGSETIIDDTVYRFDGNAYGAMIMERQNEGFRPTGLDQAIATIAYIIPSFIYKGKSETEAYMRNEEGYQDQHYGFPDVDYVSNFWTLLFGYTGTIAFLVLAPLLGWSVGWLDNWLATHASVASFLIGISISIIPLTLEIGVAGILYQLRGLIAILGVVRLLTFRRRGSEELPGRELFIVTSQSFPPAV